MTSLTFQNSEGVFGAAHQSAESLRAQILPVVKEFHIAAVKIGMLPAAEIVSEVARLIRDRIAVHDVRQQLMDRARLRRCDMQRDGRKHIIFRRRVCRW